MNLNYFNQLGYKTADLAQADWIIKDFQSHAGLKADGIIGTNTKVAMAKYNHKNYCPEVFEPIKPYIPYTDAQVEAVLEKELISYGAAFNYFSKENDFDVMHNVNHAALESNWGTSSIAHGKNNLYGFAAYDSSPYASATSYKDYNDSIEAWSKKYNQLYLTQSGNQYRGNNEYCVNIVYASSSIAGINKSFLTRQLRDSLLTPIVDYSPNSTVPGAPNFTFKEGYSNTQINGVRKYKVDPIPLNLIDNAIRVFQNLQLIRNHFNVVVIISSSGNLYRNPPYNIVAGGSSKSFHLLALAADVLVVGIPSRLVYAWAKDNTAFKGFGIINSNWIHLDLRDTFWYQEY